MPRAADLRQRKREMECEGRRRRFERRREKQANVDDNWYLRQDAASAASTRACAPANSSSGYAF